MDRVPVDDESTPLYVSQPQGEKENIWVVVAAFFSMLGGIFHAIHEFFDTMSMTASSRYLWETNQRRFFEEASRDIEAITSANTTESISSVGTRANESPD